MRLAELYKVNIYVATIAVYNKKSIAMVLRVFFVFLISLLSLSLSSMLLKILQPLYAELLI
jgi:hypothetical protein